jgi:altronate hydrolase
MGMIELTEKRVAGPVIRLHPADNVVIARIDVGIGTPVSGEGFTSRSQVPAGHKLAARAIREGEAILKYNVCIGFAATDIAAGSYVHSDNVTFREFDRDDAYASEYVPTPLLPPAQQASFMGYRREDGQVGTRNFIGILSTVNCSATVVHKVAQWFTPERLQQFPNIDGVVGLSHGLGCGMEMTGEPMDLLRRTLGGYQHAREVRVACIGVVS